MAFVDKFFASCRWSSPWKHRNSWVSAWKAALDDGSGYAGEKGTNELARNQESTRCGGWTRDPQRYRPSGECRRGSFHHGPQWIGKKHARASVIAPGGLSGDCRENHLQRQRSF